MIPNFDINKPKYEYVTFFYFAFHDIEVHHVLYNCKYFALNYIAADVYINILALEIPYAISAYYLCNNRINMRNMTGISKNIFSFK